MRLITEPYNDQTAHWPTSGRHILSQYDENRFVVYQAYKPQIGHFAARHGHFGSEAFSLNRMTWVKPNFLWMMHRCGWATKENQEVILAIWLDRAGFDAILKKAVLSSYDRDIYESEAAWKRALSASAVRVQWDPDYSPVDGKLERRALQIGLGGKAAAHYAQGGWIIHIEDITDFVHEQHKNAVRPYVNLILPRERPYVIEDVATIKNLGMSDL